MYVCGLETMRVPLSIMLPYVHIAEKRLQPPQWKGALGPLSALSAHNIHKSVTVEGESGSHSAPPHWEGGQNTDMTYCPEKRERSLPSDQ